MENLYLQSSPLNPLSHKMQRFLLNDSFVVNFVLLNAGSFENETRRREFGKMVEELERIPQFGMGPDGTNLWFRDYKTAVENMWTDEKKVWTPKEVLRNFYLFKMDPKWIKTKYANFGDCVGFRHCYIKCSILSRQNAEGDQVIDSFSWQITYNGMRDFTDVHWMLQQRSV